MSVNRTLKSFVLIGAAIAFLLAFSRTPLAQPQAPSRVSHINDFASVVDSKARIRLENILSNFQRRTGIQFDVATVQSTTGRDIFDFSRQMARDWNVGARTTVQKSLLLVIAIDEKAAFTQFSRTVQPELPEGLLGEIAQRLRVLLLEGQFNLGVNDAVEHLVAAFGRKLAFKPEELDTPPPAETTAVATEQNVDQTAVVSDAARGESPAVRKRQVRATKISSESPAVSKPQAPDVRPADATSEDSKTAEARATREKPTDEKTTVAKTDDTKSADLKTAAEKIAVGEKPAEAKSDEAKTPAPKTDDAHANDTADLDADEAEEVELTLTLPLAERIVKLKEFIAAHPNSKSKGRAYELLVSAHATLGDKQLVSGDVNNGLQELMLAIEDAPTDASEKLYAGVIAQIPLNMYLRNERIAAFKAAQAIEAKFGSDAGRLLGLANFYLGIELGDEAVRLATKAVDLAPNAAEAHYTRGLGLHISLRLDEAAAEYKRAIELDGNFRAARRSLADLNRANGNFEEALAFYREQLTTEPKDKAARTGMILALLDMGKKEEGEKELEAALQEDPKNVTLLAGAAYWFAAHNDSKRALEFGRRAVEIEPRYTWSQIALARALVGEKRPLDAERAIRFARQYGKFPTLDYELATVLASVGLYEEAAEVLAETFTLKDGEIEARLGGRAATKAPGFIELLGPERRASLFQFTGADSTANANSLKSLLEFWHEVKKAQDSPTTDEELLIKSGKAFAGGDDAMRIYRQLFVANRLLRVGKGLNTVLGLAEAAKNNINDGIDVPAATVAVQADELRPIRSRAISSGATPDIPQAPRNLLGNILRGRIDDLTGWTLFNQEKTAEAIEPLRRAVYVLPEGTPAWTTATWHLGAALEQTGSKEEALTYYIKSYKSTAADSVRLSVIEQLYIKVNGSKEGLEQRLSASATAASVQTPTAEPASSPSTSPESSSATTQTEAPPSSPEPKPTTPSEVPESKPEATPAETPQPTPEATPSPSPESTPSPSPTESPTPTRTPSNPEPSLADLPANPPPAKRTQLKVAGKVKDATGSGIANVVVVIISPGGSVMASTTDTEGNFTFTVSPSDKPFRILPSKEGLTFTPIDKSLVISTDDVKDIEFVAAASSPQ